MGLRVAIGALLSPFRSLAIALIYFYKLCISPLLPKTCRFYPSCSTYMMLAIVEFGVFGGIWRGTKRLLRCRPGVAGGEDFLPLNIKGDFKWIF